MELLEWMSQFGHERVLAVQDPGSGLHAWIALHHTRRGPAYGGIRVWSYRDEAAAAMDALRLSRAMTYKCVLAGVAGGGAKTVVMADRLKDRRAGMAALGRFIEELGGVYRAGPDAGFTAEDHAVVAANTRFLAHHSTRLRPAGAATAEGAEWGIRAALEFQFGSPSLEGLGVAVQGLGAVGLALAQRLIAAGARVVGADVSQEVCRRAAAAGVELMDPARICEAEVALFCPCALGGVLHDLSIQRLRAQVVAGCANNVLAGDEHAQTLKDRDVLFVPDFVLNSGALIEGAGHDATGRTDFSAELRGIGRTVTAVLSRAADGNVPTTQAAVAMAQEILDRERPRALERS